MEVCCAGQFFSSTAWNGIFKSKIKKILELNQLILLMINNWEAIQISLVSIAILGNDKTRRFDILIKINLFSLRPIRKVLETRMIQ